MFCFYSVVQGRPNGCTSRQETEITSPAIGGGGGASTTGLTYISSYVTSQTGCGSINSPWTIRVAQGQRVNLTLLDFSTLNFGLQKGGSSAVPGTGSGIGMSSSLGGGGIADGGGGQVICMVYAIIKESSGGQTRTVCGGKSRETNIYSSVTNSVEVRIISKRTSGEDDFKFMLYYNGKCFNLGGAIATWSLVERSRSGAWWSDREVELGRAIAK